METIGTDVAGDNGVDPSTWSPDQLIPFGKYLLLERVSVGATSAVFSAKIQGAAGFERLVAIKRILPHMAGDPDFVDTFVREAKIAARMTHTNICPIYELGRVGESLYISMEYLQGCDLKKVLRHVESKGKMMPFALAAWVAAKLCDALDYAHNLKDSGGRPFGVVHRDVSPTNIVLTYEGQVKLIDFGLAKAVGRSQQSNVDALKEKLGYMSPEMVRGQPLDERTDIYGLGVCLYEMVTGRRLFPGNDVSTLSLVMRGSIPPPSALMEDCPDKLEQILMKALRRERDERWSSAAEMGDALHQFLREEYPSLGPRQLAEWMEHEFEELIAKERQRMRELLKASNIPGIFEARRRYFTSPEVTAAMTRAIAKRITSLPPATPSVMQQQQIPKTPPVPRELQGAERHNERQGPAAEGDFDDMPTGFYDAEQRELLEGESATRVDNGIFDEQPTGFYDADRVRKTSGSDAPAHDASELDGFEEEATEIYFNKEEGIDEEVLAALDDGQWPPSAPATRPAAAPAPVTGEPAAGASPGSAPGSSAAPQPPEPSDAFGDMGTPEVMVAVDSLVETGDTGADPLDDQVFQHSGSAGVLRPETSGYDPELDELAKRNQLAQLPSLIPAPAEPEPRRWGWWIAGLLLVALLLAAAAVWVPSWLETPTGTLVVRTAPTRGAEVFVDGEHRGATPLRLPRIPAGEHRVQVRAPDHGPITKQVTIEREEMLLLELDLD